MRYLQADTAKSMLAVLPDRRDWSDMHADKHFEYHTATLLLFSGQPFTVRVDATRIPYAAILHIQLFARLANHVRANHKNQLRVIEVINPGVVARIIHKLLSPLIPAAVQAKIIFKTEVEAAKKLE